MSSLTEGILATEYNVNPPKPDGQGNDPNWLKTLKDQLPFMELITTQVAVAQGVEQGTTLKNLGLVETPSKNRRKFRRILEAQRKSTPYACFC